MSENPTANVTWCIFGSRGVSRDEAFAKLTAFADEHGYPDVVFSGAARGADTWGEQWAEAEVSKIRVVRFPADWNKHGRAAGPIRNREMARALKEAGGIGVALWDGESRGTRDMIHVLQELGVHGYVLLVHGATEGT